MAGLVADSAWKEYEEKGYLRLGRLLDDANLKALQKRIDDIMLGQADCDYGRMLMQLDSETGKYEDAGEQSKGHKGPRVDYRKIQDLEYDNVFLRYMQLPIFEEICTRVYGPGVPVGCFRAMFMNKPAHKGTFLPWHQDRWTDLDRDPLLTVWTALDPATIANGAVQVIPGTHRQGLLNPSHPSGFLTDELARKHCPADKVVYLELAPGEVVLLHNYLLHASDVNKTDVPRRAFSVCYMDGRTVSQSGAHFNVIFGPGAMKPR